jgi:uncharacterized protein (TIGR03435 family)
MHLRLSTFAIAASLSARFAAAQTTPAPSPVRPVFEAAVIKPNTSGSLGDSSHGSQGQVLMKNISMRRLLERALVVRSYQLEGPQWMDSAFFDISGKYPIGLDPADRPRVLRNLLEDRFGLVLREESRPLSGYAMVALKGGIKAKPSTIDDGSNSDGDGKVVHFHTQGVSMSDLASYVARRLNLIVEDRTGAPGLYAFEMTWSAASDNPKAGDPDPGLSLFDELQKNVGVKLQPAKIQVPVFVVNELRKTPSDN